MAVAFVIVLLLGWAYDSFATGFTAACIATLIVIAIGEIDKRIGRNK